MTKWNTVVCGVFLSVATLALTASAEDYSSRTTEELSRIRSSIHDASKEDQDSFYREWDSRLRGMSDDQRRHFTGSHQYDDSRGRGRDSRSGESESEVRGRESEMRGREAELRGRAQEGEGLSSGTGDHRGGSGSGHDGSGSSGSGSSGSSSSGSSSGSGKGSSGSSGSSGKGGGKKGGK